MTKIPQPLITDIAEGRCLPFIGAGFSLNADMPPDLHMPDWEQLTAKLAESVEVAKEDTPPITAQKYEKLYGRVQLIETIRGLLHPHEAKPGKAHQAFVRLPFTTIYTTNFDLLLEDAYTEEKRPFRSLVGNSQMSFHAGQVAANIIKMHGDLRHEEHIVVTQADYQRYLKKYPMIATHLSAQLITQTPLFIGYSLSDTDFKSIFNVIRSRLGVFQRMAYVIQFNKSKAEIERSLDDKLHIISVDTTRNEPYDTLLANLLEQLLQELDNVKGRELRASRPDVFEVIDDQRLEENNSIEIQTSLLTATSSLCFVMMPFRKELNAVYYEFIRPVVERLGLKPLRADEMYSDQSIMENIRASIQQSRLCIADLTSNNPNVMYEVGLAQASGKPIIFIAQGMDEIAFDLRSYHIIIYGKPPDDFSQAQQSLTKAIQQVLEQDRLAEAERLINFHHYASGILILSVTLESLLQSLAMQHEIAKPRNNSLSLMIRTLSEREIISEPDARKLQYVVNIRNQVVHSTIEPNADEAQIMLNTVKDFQDKYF